MDAFSHLFRDQRVGPEQAAQNDAEQTRNVAIIEKFARAVVARRLEAPAALFLELNRPLGFLFSQATLFARPFLGLLLPVGEIEAAAEVLDDPASLERLMSRIETLSAERGSH